LEIIEVIPGTTGADRDREETSSGDPDRIAG
jgi:hypothetical protein